MADAIIVINAGSSSLTFSVFVVRAGELALDVRGQVKGALHGASVRGQGSGGPICRRAAAGQGRTGRWMGRSSPLARWDTRSTVCRATGV